VSEDAAFATRVRHLSTQARASQDEYDHDMIGYQLSPDQYCRSGRLSAA